MAFHLRMFGIYSGDLPLRNGPVLVLQVYIAPLVQGSVFRRIASFWALGTNRFEHHRLASAQTC